MTFDEAQIRLNVLFTALSYGTENPWALSLGERIIINQERGRLLALPEEEYEPRPVPELIEKKIKTIELIITDFGFRAIEKPPYWNHL